MKIALVAALLILSGCATTEPAVRTVEVKVPVPIPCKTPEPAVPELQFTPPYDDIFNAVRDLVGDREVMLAYEAELRAALKSCK